MTADVQLAHNEWDPAARTSRPEDPLQLRPDDQLDRDAIERLIVSLTRLLDPAAALTGRPARVGS